MKHKGEQGGAARTWWRVASLVGIGCSSLCFLALPLFVVWAPASALGWLHNERLTRTMLVMFLAMALIGGADAYRHHGSPRPGLLAVLGGVLIVLAAWGAVAPPLGWPALAALIGAWIWDRRLLKKARSSCGTA